MAGWQENQGARRWRRRRFRPKLDVLQRPDAPYDLTDEHAMEEGPTILTSRNTASF
jgi:hypothetical protein